MKNIFSILLIIASIGIFFMYIKPALGTVTTQVADLAVYNDTLVKAGQLESEVKRLQKKIDDLDPKAMARIEKLLPDKVDDIDLIFDINTIAAKNNLKIRNIELKKPDDRDGTGAGVVESSFYDSVDLTFEVAASYGSFLNFVSALERSLRIVDITDVTFAPSDTDEQYAFTVTLRTYWLK